MGTVESMYLVRLARDRSGSGRKAFAEALSEMFVADGGSLTSGEREMVYDILHRVVRDIEISMRREVSRHLAELTDIPHELALALANDEIEVAYPILSLSTVLLDADLIAVAHNRSVEHQLAIAQRDHLSETVSGVLVDLGDENVICALLKNASARISSATMEYLVEQSRRVDAFQEPILRRADLAPELAERMIMWVAAALRQYIVDNFEIDESVVDDALETTALDIIHSGPAVPPPQKADQLADVLATEEQITPDLLISSLRDGEMPLFVSLFKRLTGLNHSLIMEIMVDTSGEGLAVACKACGIGKAYFASIYALVRRTRPVEERRVRREIRTVFDIYDRMTEESAAEVVRRWRRNVSYLVAIRDLKLN